MDKSSSSKIMDSIKPPDFSSNTLNNNNSNSIFNSVIPNSTSNSNTNTSGIVGFFKSISWTTWFIIFIILSFLGINIFVYLAKGTEYTEKILDRITNWISGIMGTPVRDTAKQTINVSATGTKAGINTVANTATQAVDIATKPFQTSNTNTNVKESTAYTSQSNQPVQNPSINIEDQDQVSNSLNNSLNNSLDNALNNATSVQADDSYSSVQRNKSSNKSGWCFIGEEEGIRSCVEVGLNDTCMSGDIFPTNAVCVNPNLRV